MDLQSIEGLPIDCWPHFHLSADRSESSSGQLKGDLCLACCWFSRCVGTDPHWWGSACKALTYKVQCLKIVVISREKSRTCCFLSRTRERPVWGSDCMLVQKTMIKNMLKWRKESDTCLTTVCRHRWSREITMKVDKLPELSANTINSTADESHIVG